MPRLTFSPELSLTTSAEGPVSYLGADGYRYTAIRRHSRSRTGGPIVFSASTYCRMVELGWGRRLEEADDAAE